MIHILLLEDDFIIAELIQEYLETKNYTVEHCYAIEKAKELLENNSYDMYLFDVNLYDGESFSYLKKLRADGDVTPTIFLTAKNQTKDVKIGFENGCDDYIKKPFELEELEIRIENIARLHNLHDSIDLGDNMRLIPEKLLIQKVDRDIKLTKKEMEFLLYLVKNYSRVISHDELSINLYDYDTMPSDATIRTYIKNLRHILENERIETVRGVGYRFIKK